MNGTSLEDIQKKLEQVLARPVPLVQGGTPLPGIEPGTRRLTAVCSTAELKRNSGSEPTANFGEYLPRVLLCVWVVRLSHTHN